MEIGNWKTETRRPTLADAQTTPELQALVSASRYRVLGSRHSKFDLPISSFEFRVSNFEFRISILALLAGLNLIHDLLRAGLRQMEKARAMRNLLKCGNEQLGVGQGFFLEFSLDL